MRTPSVDESVLLVFPNGDRRYARVVWVNGWSVGILDYGYVEVYAWTDGVYRWKSGTAMMAGSELRLP